MSNKNNDLLRIFAISRKLIIIIDFNFRIKIPSSQRTRIYANFSWIVFPICHKIFVTKLHFSNFHVQNRNRISFRHLPIIGCKSGVQIRSINKKKKKTKMKRFSIDCLTSLSRTLFSNSRQVSHEEGIEESGWRQQCDCCLWVTGWPRAIMKMGAKQRRDWWGIAKVTNCQHYCCGVTHLCLCPIKFN